MRIQKYLDNNRAQFIISLLALSIFCVVLSLARMAFTGTTTYWFLIWNLFLAWVPLFAAWLIYLKTEKNGLVWSRYNIFWSIIWLLFLPNAFYLFTDLVHLQDTKDIDFMYDVVLFSSYLLTGLVLGYTSLIMVHRRAYRRFGKSSNAIALAALLASGFAIYLGRFLRWNSWDVILNPFGILFDVSERIINPVDHAFTFIVTTLIFIFLSLFYFVIWRTFRLFHSDN